MTRALVIGYGSIGRRHARLLAELGCEVAVVSRHAGLADAYRTVAEALAAGMPDYAVVATETSAHGEAVRALATGGFAGALLIEKPLVEKPLIEGPALPAAGFRQVAVAYNLRFHPLLDALRDRLAGDRICAIEIYCGQYLPDWRPDEDYRRGYSADPARGGGVLRDLSHELDYLLWLGGPWTRVAALGGRFGDLEIESDDCWGVLAELECCPVATVQINYLDRPGVRRVRVNGAAHTYVADFSRRELLVDGKAETFEVDRDAAYLAQHRAMLAGETDRVCSLAEGEAVMGLIAAVERARDLKQWVSA